ncbi:hypothetical protein [Cohnella boryungensis]|uniref:Uncharacterized protein n=1 Tax=Cohnella boryungensis TaxID=768479 RepID=A0ABV8SG26_9BACL
MIRYGDEQWAELEFKSFRYEAQRRDGQWIDVALVPVMADRTPLPADLVDFSIVAVCTHQGHPIQLITQDEGVDCEYQLTEFEKEQINAFVRSEEVRLAVRTAADRVEQ